MKKIYYEQYKYISYTQWQNDYSKQTDAEKYYGRFPFSLSISFCYLNNFGSNHKNHNLANFI